MDKVLLKKIKMVLKKHGIKRAAVFGSYARGNIKKSSDIDLLVKFGPEASLFDLIRLEMDLKKTLRKKVDVVTYDSIHPLIRKNVLKDQVPLYG
jgi:predicted nucleotidyltransferase